MTRRDEKQIPQPQDKHRYAPFEQRIRLTVTRWDNRSIYGRDMNHEEGGVVEARYATESSDAFAALAGQLYEGAGLNLLSVEVKSTEAENGSVRQILFPF